MFGKMAINTAGDSFPSRGKARASINGKMGKRLRDGGETIN